MRRSRGLWHTVWLNIFTGHLALAKVVLKKESTVFLSSFFCGDDLSGRKK